MCGMISRLRCDVASPEDREFQQMWCRRALYAMTFGLGFSQGCGLAFFVGSGGYFSALFENPRFFTYACASFYLPPIPVSVAQLLLDRRFDAWLGIKPVIRFRVMFSSLAMVLLLGSLGFVTSIADTTHSRQNFVLCIGVALGTFAAVLASSTSVLFGAVEPRFVPCLILGQTFAGVYTNVAARVIGFTPGCDAWQFRTYFLLAAGTVLLITVVFQLFNSRRLLNATYQQHEMLLVLSQESMSSGNSGLYGDEASTVNHSSPRTIFGLFPLCWAMAACSTAAITMNMSLTPLSNQIANGDYAFAQTIVLVKLSADFAGRSLFLLLPHPRNSRTSNLCSVRGHAACIAGIEVLRLPFWILIYCVATKVPFLDSVANNHIFLLAVWFPLVSSGAFTASWSFVVALTAANGYKMWETALLMSSSVFSGFALGVGIALLTQ